MNGYAPINQSSISPIFTINGTAGGSIPNDNSGSLCYVIVKYGGGRYEDITQTEVPRQQSQNTKTKNGHQKQFHKISEVRQRQGVTLRNVARRLGIEMAVVRKQEQADSDLRVSDLLKWQKVLDVPLAELLEDGEDQLSGPVLTRSRMVKLMKTAAAIREQIGMGGGSQLVTQLIGQILEMMPELEDITPWHTVGQRRTLDDVGRAARNTMPDDLFGR